MKTSLLLLGMTAMLLTSCKDDSTEPTGQGNLRIEFKNVVDDEGLNLNNRNYRNANGDEYTVSQLMYYVSNFALQKKDGSTYQVPESYFLIDEEKPTSRIITLTDIPAGDYTGVSFVIGVDSARNCSGAQTGALDIANGMFWSWNTGYIFVRMEGNSPQSTQPNGKLLFHIGGFRGATNCIRTASPSLNGTVIPVRAGKTPEIHYQANIAKLFDAPNKISFGSFSLAHGGPNVVKMADNYQDMFTFDHIHAAN